MNVLLIPVAALQINFVETSLLVQSSRSLEPIDLEAIDSVLIKVLIFMQTYVIVFPLVYCWCFGCPCTGYNTAEVEFERMNKDEAVRKKKAAKKAAELLHQQRLRAQQQRMLHEKKVNAAIQLSMLPACATVQVVSTPGIFGASTNRATNKPHSSGAQTSI